SFPHPLRWAPGRVYLGLLPNTTEGFASAVSPDGATIIGTCTGAGGRNWAFVWTQAGGMQGLGELPNPQFPDAHFTEARGISGDGLTIVGHSNFKGFRWTNQGGLQEVSEHLTGETWTYPSAISLDGAFIVGEAGTSTG